MSPLGFDDTQMYKFISIRFESTSASVQEQTLSWLQVIIFIWNIVIYFVALTCKKSSTVD